MLLNARRGLAHALIAAGCLSLTSVVALAQSAIEMDAAGASTTAPTAVQAVTLPVTMRNNGDNPTGNTFGPVTSGPVPVVTFTLLNQVYSAVPTAISSTGTGVFLGSVGNTAANAYYGPLSSVGTPANIHFTALPFHAAGQGISTVTNHGARFLNSASALQVAGAPLTGRLPMADLDISFNVPVKNPVLHLGGLGGSLGTKGFSAEFDFLPASSPNATGLVLLSGNGALSVVGNVISNTSTNPGASCSIAGALGALGNPANSDLTALPHHTAGPGMKTTSDHGVRFTNSSSALQGRELISLNVC